MRPRSKSRVDFECNGAEIPTILFLAAGPQTVSAPSPAGVDPGMLRRRLEQIERLLIIRLRSLGDSILALPLMEALHAWRPELQIDVLVEAPYAGVFCRNPSVHETLSVRPRSWPEKSGWSRARACIEIRKRRYPAVINLHGGSTSLLFTAISGAPTRIGQQKYRHAWLYTALMPPPRSVWQRSDLHTAEDQLTLFPWLGLPAPERPRGRLVVDEGARRRIRERLASAGIPGGGHILMQPTATLRTKQWPEQSFAALADRLAEKYSLPLILTSAPREAQVLLDVGRHAKHSHFYWSDLGLDELFALIESCRLFVGNDSGPTHAAAALGKPLVVVWGSSDFRVWRPWEAAYEAVRLNLPCMPCPGYRCEVYGTPRCILEIGVDEVLAACERNLKSDAPNARTGVSFTRP